MRKLIVPGACASVPVQSTWQTSPVRHTVSTILNGPLPIPSSSTQSVNVTGSSGMYRRTSAPMARRVRSMSAAHAASYSSVPKRSHSSITRVSAVRHPAMSARRSLSFMSGVRVLLRMTSSAVRFRTPPSTILTGGIRRPSSQIDVASLTWLPATFPPTSIMCPNIDAKPMCRSPTKIGRIDAPVVECVIEPLLR